MRRSTRFRDRSDRSVRSRFSLQIQTRTSIAGDFSTTFGLTSSLRSKWQLRSDTIQAFPLGARRGGVKHCKNSPRVTVFSQSGPAMLRAGRWQRRGNLPEGKCRKRTRASQLARGGSPPSEANRVANEGNRIPIINVMSFPLIRLAFAMLRQSTFPRGGRLNRLRTRIIINCCRSPILAFPLPGDSHGHSVPSE